MATEPADFQLLEKSPPSPTIHQPTPHFVGEGKRREEEPLATRVKRFLLHLPMISILVGGALFLAEVTLIVIVLSAPGALGISDDIALLPEQRYLLGSVTIVMLIEAFLLGIIDTGKERKRARALKTRQHLAEKHLRKLKQARSPTGTSDQSTVPLSPDLASLLIDHFDVSQGNDDGFDFSQWSKDLMESVQEVAELRKAVNRHTLQYVASLLFELASFLWKWALTLLVISNNWISVSVAIAGGVVYPVVVFWQKSILP